MLFSVHPVEIVRKGYNQAAERYLAERRLDGGDLVMLDEFETRVPKGGRVLDLGCGAGVPVAKRLAERYGVTGIDISENQIRLAREAVTGAEFRVADMIEAEIGEAVYDGVVSFYAMIHVPREHHRAILAKVRRALKPGGVALLCLGAEDLEADIDEICGAEMFWSHFDAGTYLQMLPEVGLSVEIGRLVTDASCPDAKHLFVVARAVLKTQGC